ncbi:MAG: hypothetical protein R3E39_08620 [Anaerolineae bacterium]
MPRSKLLSFTFLLVLYSLILTVPLAAQDFPVRTIPLSSPAFHGKLSPDGKTLVTFEDTNMLGLDAVDAALLPAKVIDIASGKELAQLSGFTDFVADADFTSDGQSLATFHGNGDLYIWNAADWGKPATVWHTALFGPTRIQFMPDNKTLMVQVGGIPQRFVLLDTTNGYITQTIGPRFDSFLDFRENYVQFPGQGDITFASFEGSPDGKLLATATANDEVQVWNIADNSKVTLRPPSEKFAQFNIRQLLFTPDSQSLLYFDRADNLTHIWDVATQTETGTMGGGQLMGLTPDGIYLAWVEKSEDGNTGVFVASLSAPDSVAKVLDLGSDVRVVPSISFLYFTPDGGQMVLGGLFAKDENNAVYVIQGQ